MREAGRFFCAPPLPLLSSHACSPHNAEHKFAPCKTWQLHRRALLCQGKLSSRSIDLFTSEQRCIERPRELDLLGMGVKDITTPKATLRHVVTPEMMYEIFIEDEKAPVSVVAVCQFGADIVEFSG